MAEELTYDELENAVRFLEERAEQQRNAEKITRVLFEISNAVTTAQNLEELYAAIHGALNRMIYLPNFFIAIYNKKNRSISFPYFVDEYDHDHEYIENFSENSSLTGDVILAGQPLFLTSSILAEKAASNGILGTVPKIWLGIPLKSGNSIIGVMAVQNYSDPDYFTPKDMDIFISVSDQIAVAIKRKQTQERLRESKERFRKLTDNITDIIWSMDLEFNYTFISQSARRIHGWSRDDLASMTVDRVLTPESLALALDVFTNGFDEALRTGDFSKSYTLQLEMYRGDGTVFNGEITAVLDLDSEGKPIGILGVSRDISERLAAQQALRESEKKYRTLVETTDTGFVILDRNFRVIDANLNYIRLSGNERLEDILGHSITEWTSPGTRDRYMDALKACLLKGRIRDVDSDYVDADGTLIPVGTNAAIVETAQGTQIMALCRNISRRLRVQEMVVQSEKMFSLGGLAAGMAHEINNPLAGIIQNIQVAINRLTRDLPANNTAAGELGISLGVISRYMEKRGILKQLESIHTAGRRASDIVSNMLAFSRKDSRQFERHHLDQLLDRTVDLIMSDYNLNTSYDFRFIAIHRDYDPETPAVECEGNTLQQAFLNILKNGAEAMVENSKKKAESEQTEPRFHLRIHQDADMAVVEIEDNGPGMEESNRKQVFEPFFTTKSTGAGTGLGLSLSYFIVTRHHGGSMEVVSEPGKGTTFVIRLPVEQGQ